MNVYTSGVFVVLEGTVQEVFDNLSTRSNFSFMSYYRNFTQDVCSVVISVPPPAEDPPPEE